MLSLIMNAIEALSQTGDDRRELLISNPARRDCVLVALRDSRSGLPEFSLERAFEAWENSRKKAYTARTFRQPSGRFAENVKGNPTAGALFLTNIVPVQGALPIMVGDDTIGAIGVSGAPGGDKDEACAKAGLDKVSADLK